MVCYHLFYKCTLYSYWHFFNQLTFKRLFLLNYSDLNLREFINLFLLLFPVIYFGLSGSSFISFIEYKFLFDLAFLNQFN